MADTFSKEKRSWIMSRVHTKDTSIEKKVRCWLFHKGFRYRKNVNSMPGRPDIVLQKYKTVIFVHGCYWHRHPFCKKCTTPKSNTEYWQTKFDTNIANDEKHYMELTELGWNVIVIWECEVKKDFETNMQRIKNELEENYLNSIIYKQDGYPNK